MRRTATSTKAIATALTAPKPMRVSLCKAGANQTALNACKAESLKAADDKELATMITTMKSQGYAVAAFAFKGEGYTDMTAVTSWLNDGGYTDYAVTGTPGDYAVKSDDVPEGADVRTIDLGGISVTLFKAAEEAPAGGGEDVTGAEGADAASEVQPVAKSAAEVTINLGDVYAPMIARAKAAGIPEARLKSIYNISSLANLIRDLKWLVSDLNYDVIYADDEDDAAPRQAVIDDLKSVGLQLLTILSTLVGVEADDLAEAFGKPEENTMTIKTEKTADEIAADAALTIEGADGKEAGAEGGAPVAEKTEGGEAPKDAGTEVIEGADGAAEGDAPATEVAKSEGEPAPAWFASFADEMRGSVKAVSERVDAIVAEKAAPASEPVASTEVPSRKSADASEAEGSNPVETQKSEADVRFEQRRIKAALGF